MIKKIILFGDFKIGESKALKTASVMRLTYSLRTKGYDVKQIHHCTNFTSDELKQILTNKGFNSVREAVGFAHRPESSVR
jgi:hypothetical protein